MHSGKRGFGGGQGLQGMCYPLAVAAAHPSQSSGRRASSGMRPGPVGVSLLASTLGRTRCGGRDWSGTQRLLLRGVQGLSSSSECHAQTPVRPPHLTSGDTAVASSFSAAGSGLPGSAWCIAAEAACPPLLPLLAGAACDGAAWS